MSHWFREKNLWFQRQENGDIRVVTDQSDSNLCRSGPDFESLTSDHTIDVGLWISDILGLTVFGEASLYWGRMIAHHQGTHDYLSDEFQLEAFKEGYKKGLEIKYDLKTEEEITKMFYKWRYHPGHHP